MTTATSVQPPDIYDPDGWLQGSVIRTARKEWWCEGDGAGPVTRKYACKSQRQPCRITPGEKYLEYLGESHAFEHGSSHCMNCARAFFQRPKTNADAIVGDLMDFWRSLSPAELELLADLGPSVNLDRKKASRILELARRVS